MEYSEARKSLTPQRNCIVKMSDSTYETSSSSFPPRGFHSWAYTLGEWNRVANIVKLKENIKDIWVNHFKETLAYYETYDPVMSRYDIYNLEDGDILAFLKDFQSCWMNLSPQDNHRENGQLWIREKYKDGLIYITLPPLFFEEIMADHFDTENNTNTH